MPKILIPFYPDDEATVTRASAIAAGARRRRFMEVELMPLDTGDPDLRAADGLVIGVDGDRDRSIALVERVLRAGSLEEKPVGVFLGISEHPSLPLTGPAAAVVSAVTSAGGILVPPAPGRSDDPWGRYGERMARVVGWVSHALGHEHAHAQQHTHSHAPHLPPPRD